MRRHEVSGATQALQGCDIRSVRVPQCNRQANLQDYLHSGTLYLHYIKFGLHPLKRGHLRCGRASFQVHIKEPQKQARIAE